jgi:DUF4097 and DUF4098 domain-containing protein YvlB
MTITASPTADSARTRSTPPVSARLTRCLVGVSALAAIVLGLGGCIPLDGKAERAFAATEAKPMKLVVESRFLDIDLTAAPGEEVAIKATIELRTSGGNETAEREIEKCLVHVDREGDTLRVRQGKKGEQIDASSWSGRGTLSLALPPGVTFAISSASGDVAVQGDFGAVPGSISVASGDISGTLGVASFTTDAASGDSNLRFLGPLASLTCEAASGDIRVAAPSIANGSFEAASGDITITGLAGPTKASVASGDIALTFVELPADAEVTVSAASGDVKVLLPAGVEPGGSVSTASGSIQLGVPGSKAKRSASLTGTTGRVKASTASGDVTIQPAK